jgi:glycosyltransferase involved in cell wall biosynthesis
MYKPLVSVVIAVKNGERYLSSAIKSVTGQHYRPLEIIVIDGQSKDSSAMIARSFKEVRYIVQERAGLADAWNIGIDAAHGEFMAFLDHDDLWAKDKLNTQVDHLLENPELQFTIAKVRFFLEKGHSIPLGFKEELLDRDVPGRIPGTLVARKDLFKEVGKFSTDLTIASDVDWFVRVKDENIPYTFIDKTLLYKRVHNKNLSNEAKLNNKELLRILRKSIKDQRNLRSGK